MLENSTKIRKKSIGPTRKEMPLDDYKDFLKLCKILRFKSDIHEATRIHQMSINRIQKSRIGKKEFIDAITNYCQAYKKDLLEKGITI